MFEKAALEYFTSDAEVAGPTFFDAQFGLQRCIGIEPNIDKPFSEIGRWLSFFNLWWSARLLEQSNTNGALELLNDLAESYSPIRAPVLGILQDYGPIQTAKLHLGVLNARRLIQDSQIVEAINQIDKLANLQYNLAVERTGTATPVGLVE